MILGGLSAFGPLSMDMYLPGLPTLTRDLGASASTGQLTLTGCMLGIAAGQLFTGPLSDSLGRRRPLAGGLAGYIAASLACAAAPSIRTPDRPSLHPGDARRRRRGDRSRGRARPVQRPRGGARVRAADGGDGSRAGVRARSSAGRCWRSPHGAGSSSCSRRSASRSCSARCSGCPRRSRPSDVTAAACAPPCARSAGCSATGASRRRLPRSGLLARCLFAYIAGSSFVLEDVYGVSPQAFSLVFAVNSAGLVADVAAGRPHRRPGRAATLLRYGLFGVAAGSLGALVVTLVARRPGAAAGLAVRDRVL